MEELKKRVGEIVGLDLVNGKVVVGRIDSITDTHVRVRSPMEFTVIPMQGSAQLISMPYGSTAPGLTLYEPFDTKFVDFRFADVMLPMRVNQQVEDLWVKSTSGIVPAKTMPEPPKQGGPASKLIVP